MGGKPQPCRLAAVSLNPTVQVGAHMLSLGFLLEADLHTNNREMPPHFCLSAQEVRLLDTNRLEVHHKKVSR